MTAVAAPSPSQPLAGLQRSKASSAPARAIAFVFHPHAAPLVDILVYSLGERAPRAAATRRASRSSTMLNLGARGKAFLNTLVSGAARDAGDRTSSPTRWLTTWP